MYIKCVQCGKTFDLSEAEKEFYEEKNMEIPKRCKQCRQTNRIRKNDAIVPRGRERRQKRKTAMKAVPVTTLIVLIAATFLFLNFVRGGQQEKQAGNQTSVESQKDYSSSIQKGVLFRSDELLEEHYEKHGREMGYASSEEYLAGANAVIHNSDVLHKTEKEDGDDVYYVEASNDLVIVSTDGYIRTYFRPEDGIAYYNRQ